MDILRGTLQSNDKENSKKNLDSQIRRFYSGKHILLTGSTNFLGTIILEKLLRTCTEIGKIYIMIRPKTDSPIEEQMKEYFQQVVFDKLREANSDFMKKVVPIFGDLTKPDLGLSPIDRRCLVENVNIIIHNASLVHFKARVSLLLRTNVFGTQKMLEFGKECPRLEAFVYVSTALSHFYNKQIEETFYPTLADVKMVEDMIRADEENAIGISDETVNDMVGKWNNLYTFSKAVAENLVEDFGRKTSLPCVVYRPSIVAGTYREPLKSWMGNDNCPVKLTMSASLGFLHVIETQGEYVVDTVPVDMTVNGLLAVVWDYVAQRKSNEPQVYNYGSSDWNPLSLNVARDAYFRATCKYPTNKMIWYPFTIFVSNFYAFLVLHTLLHVFPAVLIDLILVIQRKKPMALSILCMATKHYNSLSKFINSNWIVRTDKIKNVQNRMNAADSKEFLFDLKTVDWYTMFESTVISNREILEDPIDAIPAAKKKYQKLMVLHYVVSGVLVLFSLLFLCRILCTIFCH